MKIDRDLFPFGRISFWGVVDLSRRWLATKLGVAHQLVYSKHMEWDYKYDIPTIDATNAYVWRKGVDIHRDHGLPAVIMGTAKTWFKHGRIHRIDGPAYIDAYNKHWYFEGVPVTKQITEFAQETGFDLDNLTEDDITIIQIKFANYL